MDGPTFRSSVQTPNIFQKYNWQWAVTGHPSLASLGTFQEAIQLEHIIATGRSVTYFETPKGVLFVSWNKPKCQ